MHIVSSGLFCLVGVVDAVCSWLFLGCCYSHPRAAVVRDRCRCRAVSRVHLVGGSPLPANQNRRATDSDGHGHGTDISLSPMAGTIFTAIHQCIWAVFWCCFRADSIGGCTTRPNETSEIELLGRVVALPAGYRISTIGGPSTREKKKKNCVGCCICITSYFSGLGGYVGIYIMFFCFFFLSFFWKLDSPITI